MSVVPSQAVVPRTFVLKPSTSLFVGGLARIDFLQVRRLTTHTCPFFLKFSVNVKNLDRNLVLILLAQLADC